MKHGFTEERIQAALENAGSFIEGKSKGPLLSLWHSPSYRQEPDLEKMIDKACAVIKADGASGYPNVIPRFLPDFGTVSTAGIWGGRRIAASDGGGIHIEPIADNVEKLADLKPVFSFEESDFQKAIDAYRKICEKLGTDRVYVSTPDLQGPMNTLALLIDQTELMCGLFSEPEIIKDALDKITDVIIEYVSKYINIIGADKVIGNLWPYIIFPAKYGISLTQDYMPLLSPEHYREFEIPLLKRISDKFGGVFIHCCGEYAHHLEVLRNSGVFIRGIEAHYPCVKIGDIQKVFGNSIFCVPRVAPNGLAEFPGNKFFESIASNPDLDLRLWIFGDAESDKELIDIVEKKARQFCDMA